MRRFLIVVVSTCALVGSAAAAGPLARAASAPAALAVTSVSPASGSAAGYQPVAIQGRDLGGTSAVLFGKVPAASFRVSSSRKVLAIAPPEPSGRVVDIRLESSAGSSPTTRADQFTFVAPAPARVATAQISHYPTDGVASIDCPAPRWCASSDDLNATGPAISTTTGSKSSTIPVPSVDDPDGQFITTVTCSTVGSCIAIGYRYSVGAMIATLEDGSVTSIPIGGLAGMPRSVLEDASCDTSICVAVGGGFPESGASPAYGAIIERDADGTWQPVPLPPIPNLSHVSCAGTTCVALGDFDDPVELVRTADGWQQTDLPTPAGGHALTPTSVDCYQQDACVVTGSFITAGGRQHPLFERWNGTSWTAFAAPRPAQLSGKFTTSASMACTPSGVCSLEGSATTSDHPISFVARLRGPSTTVAALPVPTDNGRVVRVGVTALACSSLTFCVIGGQYQTGDLRYGPTHYDVIVLSNGVWTNEPATAPFEAASCARRHFCGIGGGGAGSSGALVRTIQLTY